MHPVVAAIATSHSVCSRQCSVWPARDDPASRAAASTNRAAISSRSIARTAAVDIDMAVSTDAETTCRGPWPDGIADAAVGVAALADAGTSIGSIAAHNTPRRR